MKDFYEKHQVPTVIKHDQDSCDLEKCLYMAIEKLGEIEDCYCKNGVNLGKKENSLIIFGSSGGRIDHTFSTFHCVFKYLNTYYEQLVNTEIYMVSKKSVSVFLTKGLNLINNFKVPSKFEVGYSIIPIYGEGNIKVYEKNEEKSKILLKY